MPVRRWLVRCAIALAVAAATAGEAAAHAVLLHTQPEANTTVTASPARIHLSFNERVEPILNSIRVIDREGQRRDRGTAVVFGDKSFIEVEVDAIDPGPYTVLWRINSIDGHQVQGYFGFGVNAPPPGDETMREAALVRTSVPWAVYAGTVKWIGLVALSVWLGGLGFLVAVYAPTLSRAASEDVVDRLGGAYERIRATIWCAAAAYLVAECVGFVNHAATLADAPLADVLSPPVLANVVTKTNFGWWWGVRMAGAIALGAAFVAGVKRSQGERDLRRTRPAFFVSLVLVACGGLVLLTYPLTGHARGVTEGMAAAVASDWLHLIGTALWIGGLVTFAVTLAGADDGGVHGLEPFSGFARRFSNLALVSVCLLVLTGLYNTWLHVPAPGALVTTSYGQILLAKLVLFAVILAVAAVNRQRVVPAIAGRLADAGRWAARLRGLVTAEALVAVPLLALVAALTSVPPARTSAFGGPVEQSQRHGDTIVTLTLNPNKVGANTAGVTIRSASTNAAADVRGLTLYVKSLDMDMGVQTFEAERGPDGAFSAPLVIPMAGRSLVTAEVAPGRGDRYLVEFQIYSSS